MAITIVGSPAGDGSINGGNSNITLPVEIQEGDLVVLAGGHPSAAGGAGAVTAGYTEAVDHFNGSPAGAHLAVAYKFMGAVPDANVVGEGSTGSGNATAYVAIVLRGVDPDNPLDVAAVLSTGTGPVETAAISPVTAGAFVLSCFNKFTQGAPSGAPDGYVGLVSATDNDTNDTVSGLAGKVVSAPGEEDPGPFGGLLGGQLWAGATLAFRPLGGAPSAGRYDKLADVGVSGIGGLPSNVFSGITQL